MTTINTADDFLRALDANPAWRESVRARIMGEELLQLPAKFDAFAERQQATNERIDAFIEEQRQINERFDRFIEEQRQINERLDRSIEGIEGTLAELRRMNANAEARMNRMESDMGAVKGGHVRARLKEFVLDFTEVMNCEFPHILDRNELMLMCKRVTGATPAELLSFRRADMILLAGDRSANGEPVYLAAEASWTESQNDTDRARRNARFLTEATGIRAIPVIASVRNTREVTDLIESGHVRWYEVEERDIQAD